MLARAGLSGQVTGVDYQAAAFLARGIADRDTFLELLFSAEAGMLAGLAIDRK